MRMYHDKLLQFLCCFVVNYKGREKAVSSFIKIVDNAAVISSQLRCFSIWSRRRDRSGRNDRGTEYSRGTRFTSLGWPGCDWKWPTQFFTNGVGSVTGKAISPAVDSASTSSLPRCLKLCGGLFLQPLCFRGVGSLVVLSPRFWRQLLQRDGL